MKTIDPSELHGVVGGMRWEQYGASKNVEDRRPAWAKRRDDAWFRSLDQRESGVTTNVPLPPRRPRGL
ncbi:MAG TPA: hypothetical protein VMZ53_07635 [Kofleriaceae bacterium]|nr:hypothetical protein [Kofleriaceae bacterium]